MFKCLVTVVFERARGDSTCKRNIVESAVQRNTPNHVPSHWFPMPLDMYTPYTRVALDAASTEFQDTEKLFFQSMNNLGAACYPSGSFAPRSYSAITVCGSEVNDVNTSASARILDPECSTTRFASLAWHAVMAKGNCPFCGPFQPEPTSTVSHTELTGTSATSSSDYLDTASSPSGSTTQSRYSASTVSSAELTFAAPTSSSDNPGTASSPSGSTTQSRYSASTVSSAELTCAAPTRSSDDLGKESLPRGSVTPSADSASTVSNIELASTSVTSCSVLAEWHTK